MIVSLGSVKTKGSTFLFLNSCVAGGKPQDLQFFMRLKKAGLHIGVFKYYVCASGLHSWFGMVWEFAKVPSLNRWLKAIMI